MILEEHHVHDQIKGQHHPLPMDVLPNLSSPSADNSILDLHLSPKVLHNNFCVFDTKNLKATEQLPSLPDPKNTKL